MKQNILVIDDDKNIREVVKLYLRKEGYEVTEAADGAIGVDLFFGKQYDLVILDIMMPVQDGIETIKQIRAKSNVPVIMLTAKGETFDKVLALELGADDYIVKPFEIVELLARVEAVLRRYHKGESKLSIGDVEVDTQSRSVKKNGKQIDLTMKEYELLLLFIRNKNIALFRETIFERVWQSDYLGDTRTVDLHVQRLRKKLGWEKMIVAVYKVGYRLEC